MISSTLMICHFLYVNNPQTCMSSLNFSPSLQVWISKCLGISTSPSTIQNQITFPILSVPFAPSSQLMASPSFPQSHEVVILIFNSHIITTIKQSPVSLGSTSWIHRLHPYGYCFHVKPSASLTWNTAIPSYLVSTVSSHLIYPRPS